MDALVPLRISTEHIAGIDEAGRGCLAGPVVAAAVILPDNFFLPGLNDSKKLSPQKREKIAVEIKAQAKPGLLVLPGLKRLIGLIFSRPR